MSFEELTEQFDRYAPAEAVARAWVDLDPRRHGTWHRKAKEEIHFLMPLLARALERLVLELDVGPVDWSLWEDVRPVVPTPRNRRPRGSAL